MRLRTMLAAAGITGLAALAAPTAAQASTVSATYCAPDFSAGGSTFRLCGSEDMDSTPYAGGILHYATVSVVSRPFPFRSDLSIRVRDLCTGRTYPFHSASNTTAAAVALSVGPYLRHGCMALDGYAGPGASSVETHQLVRLP